MDSVGLGRGWEDLFWMVFRTTLNPVALFDQERRFVDLNAASTELFARSRGELLGTSVRDLVVSEQHKMAQDAWDAFQISGELSGTRTFLRGDGTEITKDFAARLASFEQGVRAVFVITDASDISPDGTESDTHLTPREREIVRLIAMGRITTEIADELFVSPETVRTHVRNAMARLQVRTRAQLVCVAMTSDPTLGLLHPGDG